jgi:ATP-dependent Lon protease
MSDPEPTLLAPEAGKPEAPSAIIPARMMLPDTLLIVPLNNRPLFPRMMTPLSIGDEALKSAITELVKGSQKIVGLVLRKAPPAGEEAQRPKPEDLYGVGVAAEILQVGQPQSPEAPLQVLVGVMERLKVTRVLADDPVLRAAVDYVLETELADNDEMRAYALSIISAIKELVQLNPLFKEELNLFLTRTNLKEPGRLADFAASLTTAQGPQLQEVLETFNVRSRIEKVLTLLRKEIDITRLQAKIGKQIEENLSQHQRHFFLREQLKEIKKELGLQKEGKETELDEFRERLQKRTLPPEAKERVDEEMQKLSVLEPASPEFTVTRNYLDWLTALPWGVFSADRYDLVRARRILNTDHYGLEDVKERILEFLSVGILKGSISGSILCFVGPPGVGKTSLGQSIARSIGRPFYRFSLGGMRDEAEIKGHRRTYIGALPGKFIQAMKTCKAANPVLMLDEVDKIGASYQGDPASALLEVLDPEQNRDFQDHYLDVRFDLSNVMFICTANTTDTVPLPLLDRMEVIKLPGYILEEKLQIARRYLIPKQMRNHGLQERQLELPGPTLRQIIDGYAREPGVRGLENQVKKICRKAARRVVEGKARRVVVNPKDVPAWLGKRIYSESDPFKTPRPGVVTGLAWTSLGGSVLHIEAIRVAAEKPGFKQTGQLGSVMVESSEIAYTFVRSFVNDDPKAREFFEKNLVHLHVPAGATPKDGPSAGITMATALYSLARNTPVRGRHAMTGELTLSGLVLPIGGVKEKALAAKRAGIRDLIFPKENAEEFQELPAHVRRGLRPHFVETFAEVVELCFPRRARGRKGG